jgi:hypothetical protein
MRGRSQVRTRRIVGFAVVAMLGLTACGKATAGTHGGPPSPAPTIRLGDQDNGRTIDVVVDTRIVVSLGSTYWSFDGNANSGILVADGAPTASPSPGCIPGGGCGTVTQTFVVAKAGTAVLKADRTSCGEAMLCQPNQRTFRVTITSH